MHCCCFSSCLHPCIVLQSFGVSLEGALSECNCEDSGEALEELKLTLATWLVNAYTETQSAGCTTDEAFFDAFTATSLPGLNSVRQQQLS